MGKQAKLKKIRRDRNAINKILEEAMESGKIIQDEEGNIKSVDSKIMGDVFVRFASSPELYLEFARANPDVHDELNKLLPPDKQMRLSLEEE